jgi:endonuclease/exonuclease/phosphatase family metal-dependent hydrolase
MFRIATYNIQKSIGLDARRRPHRILDVIEELDCDIVALQEVDRRFGLRRSTLRPEMISSRTDYAVVPVAVRSASLGWHGNAILVRRSIRILGQRRLHLPMLEPRGAVMAELEISGVLLRVVATHLSLLGAVRRRQIASITAQLQADGDDVATVVVGDMNEWRGASESLRVFHPRYRVITPGRSFPAAMPVASLDRIVTSPELVVDVAGVHRSEKARIASDHLPVWAQLSFADRQNPIKRPHRSVAKTGLDDRSGS